MFSLNRTLQQSHCGDGINVLFMLMMQHGFQSSAMVLSQTNTTPPSLALAVGMGNANSSSARRCSTWPCWNFSQIFGSLTTTKSDLIF